MIVDGDGLIQSIKPWPPCCLQRCLSIIIACPPTHASPLFVYMRARRGNDFLLRRRLSGWCLLTGIILSVRMSSSGCFHLFVTKGLIDWQRNNRLDEQLMILIL